MLQHFSEISLVHLIILFPILNGGSIGDIYMLRLSDIISEEEIIIKSY